MPSYKATTYDRETKETATVYLYLFEELDLDDPKLWQEAKNNTMKVFPDNPNMVVLVIEKNSHF